MDYKINDVFSSIQGEGKHTGLPVTFVRFAGCNRECSFCDTDFEKYIRMGVDDIVEKLLEFHNEHVVLTGGEPMLQVNSFFVEHLNSKGFKVHLETNGSLDIAGINFYHVSMSPKQEAERCKARFPFVDDVKILYPYIGGIKPDHFKSFGNILIQPIETEWKVENKNNLEGAIKECLKHGYKLSLQLHKIIGVA